MTGFESKRQAALDKLVELTEEMGLYEKQRPWIELTDEEIIQIINSNTSTGLWSMAIEIGAKLRSKNS
jgi:hypothetical protein